MATAARMLSMDAIEAAGSGHPGMPLGIADVATVLFARHLTFDAAAPDWPDRDRFVLSAGHGSALLYALLYLTGTPGMDIEQLQTFRRLGSRTPGHPEFGLTPGVEATTGPLGQGLANGVGMALAERMLNARFGDALVNHRTWVLAGDGCLMEGVAQEAIALAGHLRLARLTVLWDDNRITIDGGTGLATSEDQLARFAAAGWATMAVDGHNIASIDAALAAARRSDLPTLIACRTTIGHGAPTKAGTAGVHGAPLGPDEMAALRAALDWDAPPFAVPEPVLTAWRGAGQRGATAHAAWNERRGAAAPATRAALAQALSGELPAGWDAALVAYKRRAATERPEDWIRKASLAVLEGLTESLAELVGGSADLTPAVFTRPAELPAVAPGRYAGRYIHYGVREFAMAAVMNGLALHGGVIPYGGTFLVFADYMRSALRMAAMMGLRAIHVFTHDSIGVAEDGPTHQPIEHLAALRAIPNLLVLRPADPVEMAECWQIALATRTGPSALVLSRLPVPTLRTTHTDENLSARGAYVLAEATGPRRVTLLATGSEVALAMRAKALLDAEGIAAAVVSMPCWELFEAQPVAEQARVLGSAPRVAVEAAIRQGWDRWLGPHGAFVGLSDYGASGAYPDLCQRFGLTAQAVAEAARGLV
jgi:transketolase